MKLEKNHKIILSVVALLVVGFVLNSSGDITGYATKFPGWSFCRMSSPCGHGFGDCDNDKECLSGLKCVKDVGKNYGWMRTVDVCEGVARAGKPGVVKTTGVSQNRVSKQIPLGTLVSGSIRDTYGRLDVSPLPSTAANHVTVETSLTSAEDDYQTDVVMEVDRDSIKYYLDIIGPVVFSKHLSFLGNDLVINSASSDGKTMNPTINGVTQTVRDGDAFIGESKDDPKWVWDIDLTGSSGKAFLGIENDFVLDDDSDNPPKVGECIYLPKNYAKICLDSLNVKPNEYSTYAIEYESSADLSDAVPELTSVKTINIHTPKWNGIKLSNGVSTSKVWITGDGWVFYLDLNTNKVKYMTWVSNPSGETIGTVNNGELEIAIIPKRDKIDVNINAAGVKETISAKFEVFNREVQSLGRTNSLEEATELTWGIYGRDSKNIGTKDEDHRSAYGIIVRDPKAHGSNDEVVLDIPLRQVKANVEMSFSGGVSPTPGYVACSLDKSCFLNMNDYTTIKGKNIKLVRVGSVGAIVVDVGGIMETISAGSTKVINGFHIRNKETYYDSLDFRKSSATIVVSEAKTTTRGAVRCLKPDGNIGTCISSVDSNGRCECW